MSYAEQSGATPRDGAAVIETTKKINEDRAATKRGEAERRRAAHRAATGKDHKTIAIEKQRELLAKIAASHKRAKEDDGSGRWVVCKNKDCKNHGVPIMHYGDAVKNCSVAERGCGRRMTFM